MKLPLPAAASGAAFGHPGHLQILEESGATSALIVPLVARRRVLGAILFARRAAARAFRAAGCPVVGFDTDLIGPYGYCADISRTWLCGDGQATDEQRELVQEALDRWWGPLMQMHGPRSPRGS